MAENGSEYQSYLLRLWQDPLEQGYRWRASLEDPRTGEMEGFQDLDSLMNGLLERTEEANQEKQGD